MTRPPESSFATGLVGMAPRARLYASPSTTCCGRVESRRRTALTPGSVSVVLTTRSAALVSRAVRRPSAPRCQFTGATSRPERAQPQISSAHSSRFSKTRATVADRSSSRWSRRWATWLERSSSSDQETDWPLGHITQAGFSGWARARVSDPSGATSLRGPRERDDPCLTHGSNRGPLDSRRSRTRLSTRRLPATLRRIRQLAESLVPVSRVLVHEVTRVQSRDEDGVPGEFVDPGTAPTGTSKHEYHL